MADDGAGCARRSGPGKAARRDGGLGWQFALPAVALRAALIAAFLWPLMAVFSRRRTVGREALDSVDGPVIFAANHRSVADNLAVLLALPWRWRLSLATAASVEVLRARGRGQAFFAALISNGFPISQSGGAVRGSLDHCARLAGAGWSLLLFPEGMRSDDGAIGRFKPGVGLLAARLGLPVIPVYLQGTDGVVAKGGRRPRRGCIEVRFGPPLRLPPEAKYADAADAIRDAVASLARQSGGGKSDWGGRIS